MLWYGLVINSVNETFRSVCYIWKRSRRKEMAGGDASVILLGGSSVCIVALAESVWTADWLSAWGWRASTVGCNWDTLHYTVHVLESYLVESGVRGVVRRRHHDRRHRTIVDTGRSRSRTVLSTGGGMHRNLVTFRCGRGRCKTIASSQTIRLLSEDKAGSIHIVMALW